VKPTLQSSFSASAIDFAKKNQLNLYQFPNVITFNEGHFPGSSELVQNVTKIMQCFWVGESGITMAASVTRAGFLPLDLGSFVSSVFLGMFLAKYGFLWHGRFSLHCITISLMILTSMALKSQLQ